MERKLALTTKGSYIHLIFPQIITTNIVVTIFNHDLTVNINNSDNSGIDKVYYTINDESELIY